MAESQGSIEVRVHPILDQEPLELVARGMLSEVITTALGVVLGVAILFGIFLIAMLFT